MTSGGGLSRSYSSPAALRAGLEARLAAEAEGRSIDLDRLRRQVAFERLLVRLTGPRRLRFRSIEAAILAR